MEPSIFTRIIRGEIPSHKVYEDDKTLAFLDIHPAKPGHTIVVPKVQVDHLEELEDADYQALMAAVKKVMKRMVEVYGPDYRATIRVWGFDVPHAHVQIVPCNKPEDVMAGQDMEAEPDHDALAAEAKKLSL